MEKIFKIIMFSILAMILLGCFWFWLDYTFRLVPVKEHTIIDEETGMEYTYHEGGLNSRIGDFIEVVRVALFLEIPLNFIIAILEHRNNNITKRNRYIIIGFIILVIFIMYQQVFWIPTEVTAD